MPSADLSLGDARRIALAAQGFDRSRPRGRVDVRHIRRVIRQLGLLQIDYVNVLVPAHYQILFSRLGSYEMSRLDDLVYQRREFTEQWAHEASIIPVESWPLLRHRMDNHRVRPWGFEQFLAENKAYVERALSEVRRRGPLSADDLPDPEVGSRRMSDKWGWGSAVKRQVLEAYFGRGVLAVADRRRNLQRVYDLAERVVPPEFLRRKLEAAQAQRELVSRAALAHGIGTAADLADYYRMPVRETRQRITELVDTGELRQVRIEGWREPTYLHREARLPRRLDFAALLSPFDPVVWFRPRAARLFEFDYRIEIFVPAKKRRWGYYVLPFLLGDRLVARVDLKADRARRQLQVPAAYLEPGVKANAVLEALAGELQAWAVWLDLTAVTVGRRGNLARPLAAAVRG